MYLTPVAIGSRRYSTTLGSVPFVSKIEKRGSATSPKISDFSQRQFLGFLRREESEEGRNIYLGEKRNGPLASGVGEGKWESRTGRPKPLYSLRFAKDILCEVLIIAP
jgi:hypothetical protein